MPAHHRCCLTAQAPTTAVGVSEYLCATHVQLRIAAPGQNDDLKIVISKLKLLIDILDILKTLEWQKWKFPFCHRNKKKNKELSDLT